MSRQVKPINSIVGKRLQDARKSRGLTQAEVAEKLNLSNNHISAIERGAVGVTIENLYEFCRLYGVSAGSIVFGDNPAQGSTHHWAYVAIMHDLQCVPQERMEALWKLISVYLEAIS